MYEVFLTREAQRFYERADPVLVRKLNRCFERLRRIHMNIQISSSSKGLLLVTFAIG